VRGTYDVEIVRRVLRREQNRHRYCYGKSLLGERPPSGRKLNVTFEIAADGKTTAVRVEGISDEVENCVAAMMRRMQLPPARGGVVTVTLGMTFSPAKPALAPRPQPCRPGAICGRLRSFRR
jgi:hypothetical protein